MSFRKWVSHHAMKDARTPVSDRLEGFQERYRLRFTDTGVEKVICGRYGEIADMGDPIHLRLRLLAVPRGAGMTKALLSRRRKAEAGGMVAKWKGDAETILYFNPEDEAQSRLAIELVKAPARRRSEISDERRAELVEQLQRARGRAIREEVSAAV